MVAPTAVEYDPAWHLVHSPAPPRLYVPASHCVSDVGPSVKVQLDASMHARSVGLQAGLHFCVCGTVMLPAAEGTQVLAPPSALKNPGAQGVHVCDPSALYVPAGQGRQSPSCLPSGWNR